MCSGETRIPQSEQAWPEVQLGVGSAAGWPQHPGDSASSADIPFLPALELQGGTAETPDDTGAGNSRTEQMQGTADRIIVVVVANKNANKCTLRKNGLHVNKYPALSGLFRTVHLISFAKAFTVSRK